MYKQDQFQSNGKRNDYKDIKDKRIVKGKWNKEHWRFDKEKDEGRNWVKRQIFHYHLYSYNYSRRHQQQQQ
jgi:hypothetical protein